MSRAIERTDLTSQASAAAEMAAQKSRVTTQDLNGLEAFQHVSSLFDSVWAISDRVSMITPEMLRALTAAGNYLAGAFSNGQMVGALVGFLGLNGSSPHLHSHILGVRPEAQSKHVGFALKQHQRAWSLQRGITEVQWTFDPLVRRNAYFNITKLGAKAERYYSNFYGVMHDGINAGDESDRLLINWHLDSPEAVAASEGQYIGPDVEELVSAGAVRVLAEGPDGSAELKGDAASTLLCFVPQDIVLIRGSNAGLAQEWRKALRFTLGERIGSGYSVTGFSKSGYYVLTRR